MSATNKKSVAAQALLEMDEVISALKEESRKSLGTILGDVVKDALREGIEKSDDDEKDYEVIDDEKDDAKDDEKSEKSSSKDVSEQGEDEIEGDVQADSDPVNDPQAAAMPQQGAEMGQDAGAQEAPMAGGEGEEAQAPTDGEGEDGWDEFSQYQTGDENTYDLTGENDLDNVVKIYKLLQDDDQVVVKKDGNTIQLKDGQAGTEYVIDLGADDETAADGMEGEETPSSELNERFDVAGFPDVENDESEDDEFDDIPNGSQPWDDEDSFDDDFDDLDGGDEFEDGSFDSDELDGEEMNNFAFESKKMKKPMKESKEVLFEVDLGYTDNYQDKDPIKGLSNNEPSKSGKSWHKGVPTGTEKPWAGSSKDKSKPFGEKKVDEEEEKCCPKCGKCGKECTCEKEVDEQTNVGGFVQQNSVTTSHVPNSNGRKARSQRSASQGVEVTGSADPRYKGVNESKELKAIKKENLELKKAVMELKKNLNEAYLTNVNLGKITKLFLENTTSKSEKTDIVSRFVNEAKTIEQSNTLYETISRELKKNNSNPMAITESSKTANGTKELNENKGYKSAEVLKTIDFMNRVLNC